MRLTCWIFYSDLAFLEKSEKYDVNRLVSEARLKNIDIRVINPDVIDIEFTSEGIVLLNKGKKKKCPDFLIPRCGFATSERTLIIIEILQSKGVFVLNRAKGIRLCRDKLTQSYILSNNRVQTPLTIDTFYTKTIQELKNKLKFPLLLKPQFSSQGIGIVLVNTIEQLNDIYNLVKSKKANDSIYLQEFIEHSKGVSLRLLIFNGNILVGYEKQNQNSYKAVAANPGIVIKKINPNNKQKAVAKKLYKIFGLHFMGVDILYKSKTKYLICDVNSSPSFEIAEKKFGLNIAGRVVDYMIKMT